MSDPFGCDRCHRHQLAARYGLPGEPRLCAPCWYATHDTWPPDGRTIPPDPLAGHPWTPAPTRTRRPTIDADALARAALAHDEQRARNRTDQAPRCAACERPMTAGQTDTHWSCQ